MDSSCNDVARLSDVEESVLLDDVWFNVVLLVEGSVVSVDAGSICFRDVVLLVAESVLAVEDGIVSVRVLLLVVKSVLSVELGTVSGRNVVLVRTSVSVVLICSFPVDWMHSESGQELFILV